MTRSALVLIALLASIPAIAEGRALEEQVSSQSLIRVRSTWGEATLWRPHMTGASITFDSLGAFVPARETAAVPETLTLADLDRIQVRGSAAGSTAWKVGVFGLVAGGAFGVAVASIDLVGESNGGGEKVAGALLGGSVGFGAGYVLGALIGAPMQHWKTVYRRPPATR